MSPRTFGCLFASAIGIARTRSFELLIAAGIGAIGAGLHRARRGALRRRAAELGEAVRRRTADIERANAAKTEFLAAVSHDIRNPLNGIVGLTFALEDTALDERQRQFTTAMRGCAQYLNGIVDGVLDLARIEAGCVSLSPEAFEPTVLLQELAAMAGLEARAAGARIGIRTDPELPARVTADVRRLRQIVANFLFNAIRHAGGVIELDAARRPGPSGAAELEVSVTDRGPGVAVGQQKLLFTPFCRLAGGADSAPGTGLGLAASKRWAEAMGGRVGVESEAGRGARFWVRIPLVPAEPVEIPPAAGGGPRRILLVEDEEYGAWAVGGVLSRLGLAVSGRARTVAEARALAAEGAYDLILLDRNLPDGDGLELATDLRSRGGPPAKIVVLSAYATREDRRRCLAAGANGFVGKPLTPEKLKAALADSAVPAPSGIDTGLIAYLSDGTTAGYERELERYLDLLSVEETSLLRAWGANDRVSVSKAAHRLMGHFSMVNAAAPADAAGELETAADEPAADLEFHVRRLCGLAEALRAALRQRGEGSGIANP